MESLLKLRQELLDKITDQRDRTGLVDSELLYQYDKLEQYIKDQTKNMETIRLNAYKELLRRSKACRAAMLKSDKSTAQGAEEYLYWHKQYYKAQDRRKKLLLWEKNKGLL